MMRDPRERDQRYPASPGDPQQQQQQQQQHAPDNIAFMSRTNTLDSNDASSHWLPIMPAPVLSTSFSFNGGNLNFASSPSNSDYFALNERARVLSTEFGASESQRGASSSPANHQSQSMAFNQHAARPSQLYQLQMMSNNAAPHPAFLQDQGATMNAAAFHQAAAMGSFPDHASSHSSFATTQQSFQSGFPYQQHQQMQQMQQQQQHQLQQQQATENSMLASSFPAAASSSSPTARHRRNASSTSSATVSSNASGATVVKKQPPSSPNSRIPITVFLHSGSLKKRLWPSRMVLSDPNWSFSQLLFHAANLSTFNSVMVNGAPVQQESTLQESRHIRDWLSYTASGASTLPQPQIEVTFDLPPNVKSCTRLCCPNLLVNKANRRACSVCQTQGAELFPAQIRMALTPAAAAARGLSAANAASAAAYLELYLDQFEHWKFDGSEDGVLLVVFTDEETAARVSNDMMTNLGSSLTPSECVTLLQPVDPSQSYTIRMKSHFWMCQVKPRDPDQQQQTVRLYKKVGKPNQSRPRSLQEKQEEQKQPSYPQHQMLHNNDDTGYRGKMESPGAVRAIPSLKLTSTPGTATSSRPGSQPSLIPSQQLGHTTNQQQHYAHQSHMPAHRPNSPGAASESDSSHASLPALSGVPSSPDSYSFSEYTSQPTQRSSASGMGASSGRESRHRRVSDSEEESNSSTTPPSVGSMLTAMDASSARVGTLFDEHNVDLRGGLLAVSYPAYAQLKANKPVPALMNVHAAVGAALIDASDPSSYASTSSSGSSSASSSSSLSSSPPNDQESRIAVSTPVVLVYRDMKSYESDRALLSKHSNPGRGPKDRDERKDGASGRGNDDDDDGKDDDSGFSGHKRRRVVAGGGGASSHHQMAQFDDGLGFDGETMESPSSPDFFDSTDDEHKDSPRGPTSFMSPYLDLDMGKPQRPGVFDYDLLRLGGAFTGAERMVVMPAQFADVLMDPTRFEQLMSSVEKHGIGKQSKESKSKLSDPVGALSFFQSASESLMRDSMLASDDGDDEDDGVGVGARSRNRRKPTSVWDSLRNRSACEIFSLFLGIVSLILLLGLIVSPGSPVLTHDAPRDKDVTLRDANDQSKFVLGTMSAVSPVFAAWSNSSLYSPSLSTGVMSQACLASTIVSKTLASWLLQTQGTGEIYRSIGLLQPLSTPVTDSASACSHLTADFSDVGPAYLRATVCGSINKRRYADLVRKLCSPQSSDWTIQACTSMLDGLRAANATATALLGLEVPDRKDQYTRDPNWAGDSTSPLVVSQYLNVLANNSVSAVEITAIGMHYQSLSLASSCATFSVLNSLGMGANFEYVPGAKGQPQQRPVSDDSGARVPRPIILAFIVIGASGMLALLQLVGAALFASFMTGYSKLRRSLIAVDR